MLVLKTVVSPSTRHDTTSNTSGVERSRQDGLVFRCASCMLSAHNEAFLLVFRLFEYGKGLQTGKACH